MKEQVEALLSLISEFMLQLFLALLCGRPLLWRIKQVWRHFSTVPIDTVPSKEILQLLLPTKVLIVNLPSVDLQMT